LWSTVSRPPAFVAIAQRKRILQIRWPFTPQL
jgi:hypothetical protein